MVWTFLLISTFNYRGGIGFSLSQDIVNPLQECAALFPDVTVCRLLLNVQIENVLGEFICLSELPRVSLGSDQLVEPTHFCGPFFNTQAFYMHREHCLTKNLHNIADTAWGHHDHTRLNTHFLLPRREDGSSQNGMLSASFDLVLTKFGYKCILPALPVLRIKDDFSAGLALVEHLLQDVATGLPLPNPRDLVISE